jgi:hypothetical protein
MEWSLAPLSPIILPDGTGAQDSLSELGSVFCKIFDPDMSPLGFELDQMYHFAIR